MKDITKFVKPHVLDVKSDYEILTQFLSSKIISDIMTSEETIRMVANENPYGPSPKVLEAVKDSLHLVNRYPDPTYYALSTKISEYVGLKQENIIVGQGSLGIIPLIYNAFVDPDDEVILPQPTFEQYEQILNINGGKPVFIQLHKPDFILEPERITERVSPKTKLIIIVNPNNPIGNLTPEESIKRILDEDAIVVIDEAYFEYCKKTVAPLIPKYENLIVLRTFSKAFGLAGLRIGYGLANPEIIRQLHKLQLYFTVNTISMQAAITALENIDYAEKVVSETIKEREYLIEEISKINGLKPYSSEANFILIEITKENMDAGKIIAKLLESKILVRNCGDQRGLNEKFFRVSTSTPENNKKFIRTLKTIMK
ncbi:MAG: histidinol-phosphate transaminase [Candidatus Freyarchaeum deiterrae]